MTKVRSQAERFNAKVSPTDISSTEKTSSCTLTADGEPAENADDNEIASAAPERPHDGH